MVVSRLLSLLSDEQLLKQEDHYGWNCLHWAAYRDHFRVVEKILSKKPMVDWIASHDKQGRSPLDLSEQFHSNHVTKLIKAYGFEYTKFSSPESTTSVEEDEDPKLKRALEKKENELVKNLYDELQEQKTRLKMLELEHNECIRELHHLQQEEMKEQQEIEFLQNRIVELTGGAQS